MKKIALLIFLSALLCVSCADLVQLDIDNPTRKEKQITIDDQVILLKPESITTVEVERGYHNLYMANDSVTDYKFYENHYLINPTGTEYILEKFNYSKFSNSNRDLSFQH